MEYKYTYGTCDEDAVTVSNSELEQEYEDYINDPDNKHVCYEEFEVDFITASARTQMVRKHGQAARYWNAVIDIDGVSYGV